MNYGPLIFLGVFLTLASSWCGLVLIPQLQFGRQTAVKIEETGEMYPPVRPGMAEQGEEIYRANGCIYCHTQQVRTEGFGADILRNWGKRRTVAQDYLRDKPIKLGTMRTGPDLTNVGLRQSANWNFLHLYNPQITSPGSVMPPFRFLYEKRKIVGAPSPDALALTGQFALNEPGYEIVPKPEARALVDYLLSLKSSANLPEAI
jgi:cytochrome c oxidase cbb3-type subunit 2